MKTVKKLYFILGTLFTVISVIMLISNILLFSVHENFHHKKELHEFYSIKHDSLDHINAKHEKCYYCELLIFSAKVLSLKKILNPEFVLRICYTLYELKEDFRSTHFLYVKARSPPFHFLSNLKAV